MIAPDSLTTEWIMSHRQTPEFGKINPPILEKMIFAFALLEELCVHELNFTFKGGTALILLLPQPRRFSVDVDIQTTVDSISGDKLAAFAPNTIGVPFNRNKSLEIIKQLHDVGHLFDTVKNIAIVAQCFESTALQQIKYRTLAISPEDALKDTIATALLIGQLEKNHINDEKLKYRELILGLQQFKGYLITGNFLLDVAIESAAKAAYISAKLLTKNFDPLEKYNVTEELSFQFEEAPYNTLNRLRKIRNGSMFYWSKAAALLNIK